MEGSEQKIEETENQPEKAEKQPPVEQKPQAAPQVEQQKSSENIDPALFLKSFDNKINLSTISSVEKRQDGAIIVHCTNLYEYLKFGYSEDPNELKKIEQEKYKKIFEAYSKQETVATAMELQNKLSKKEQEWITEKLGACGSAVPVKFKDGRKESIVMMNDMPTKRMFNKDGSPKNEEQLKQYDRDYNRILEHEVRHTQFYKKFGKALEEWKKTMEKLKKLSPIEKRKYHYNRFTKDEIAAHIENEVKETEENGQFKTEVNWEGIIANLQKNDYRFTDIFISEADKAEYLKVSTALVNIAKTTYERTKSIDAVMDEIERINVEKLIKVGEVKK